MTMDNGMSHFTSLDNTPVARTNILELNSPSTDVIHSLLEIGSSGTGTDQIIAIGKKLIEREYKESIADHFKRMHREIKAHIRHRLKLAENELVRYVFDRTINRDNRKQSIVYFFYLSDRPEDRQPLLIDEALSSAQGSLRVFAGLMNLRLKLELLREARETFDIVQESLNSDYFIGGLLQHSKKHQIDFVTAYQLELDCFTVPHSSDRIRIRINLKRSALKCHKYQTITNAQLDDELLVLRKGDMRYVMNETLDARTWASKRHFFDVGDNRRYTLSYSQNLVLDRLESLLNWQSIEYTPIRFQANFGSRELISFEPEAVANLSVTLIDNTPSEFKARMDLSALKGAFNDYFQVVDEVSATDLPTLDRLQPDTAYLILNEASKDGSSIRLNDDELGTFWDAYQASQRAGTDGNHQLDYYTALKVDQLRNDQHKVIQGLNLSPEFAAGDGKGAATKLKRTATELYLKHCLYIAREVGPVDLADQLLTLVSLRRLRNDKDCLSSVVEVEIREGVIHILGIHRYRNNEELLLMHPFLEQRRGALFDDGFFIYDRDNGHLLTTYSNRMPVIIGNPNIDFINPDPELLNPGGKVTRSHKDPASVILPYYLSPTGKKATRAYIQESGPDLLYFVAGAQGAKAKIDRQNLIYNVLVFDNSGQLLRAIDQPITSTFFKSMTFNVLRVGENSKMSLLQKVARLPLEN